MGRPPSTDRKEIITLRLRKSVLDAYKAGGEDYRARMEVAIEGALAKPAEPSPKLSMPLPAPTVRKAVTEQREAPRGRMTFDDVRPKFVPRLKPDKPKR